MGEEKPTYGYLRGNTHAQKYEKPVTASLSLRCHADDKARWQAAAKAENISLNQWVIENLNKIAQ